MIVLPYQPAGVMFHHFHDAHFPKGQGSISSDDFRQLLFSIGLNRILPASEWMERASSNRLASRDLCLTFDDNLRCQFEIALPVLEELKLTAFWFIYTSVNQGTYERLEIYRQFRTVGFESVDDFYASFNRHLMGTAFAKPVRDALSVFDDSKYLPGYDYLSKKDKEFRFVRDRVLGRTNYEVVMDSLMDSHEFGAEVLAAQLWMNDDNLMYLDRSGHIVGLHSHTHPTTMGELDQIEQTREYSENYRHLRSVLGVPPQTMSHPNNSYDSRTLAVLAELGITLGFRANMQMQTHGPLEMPRHNHAVLHRQMLDASK
jgi:peptidoglycan/xylan/chitin deacetylase (PgdA/CDA1 family)